VWRPWYNDPILSNPGEPYLNPEAVVFVSHEFRSFECPGMLFIVRFYQNYHKDYGKG
jgi:hypothetical protein